VPIRECSWVTEPGGRLRGDNSVVEDLERYLLVRGPNSAKGYLVALAKMGPDGADKSKDRSRSGRGDG